jgi:hypothetical protein
MRNERILMSIIVILTIKTMSHSQASTRGKVFYPEAFEFSIKLRNCGRVILHSTQCKANCKTKNVLLPGKNLQKITFYASSPIEFVKIAYNVRCPNGKTRLLKLKAVQLCACVKQSTRMESVKISKASIHDIDLLLRNNINYAH